MQLCEIEALGKHLMKSYGMKITEDRIQDVYLAYLKCKPKIDPSRTIPEQTKFIVNAIKYTIFKKARPDIFRHKYPTKSRHDDIDELKWVWAKLTKREKIIFKARCLHNKSMEQIGCDLNISKQRIEQVIKGARRRISEIYSI